MNETEFWELIEVAYRLSGPDVEKYGTAVIQYSIIKDFLEKSDTTTITDFHNIFCKLLTALYLPKIGDLFNLTSYDQSDPITQKFNYISDDGFIDFRGWMVSLGRKHYERFLHFKSEEELLTYDMNINVASREDLVFLAPKIGEQKGLDLSVFEQCDGDGRKLHAGMNWNTLDQHYPQLFAHYQALFQNGFYEQ